MAFFEIHSKFLETATLSAKAEDTRTQCGDPDAPLRSHVFPRNDSHPFSSYVTAFSCRFSPSRQVATSRGPSMISPSLPLGVRASRSSIPSSESQAAFPPSYSHRRRSIKIPPLLYTHSPTPTQWPVDHPTLAARRPRAPVSSSSCSFKAFTSSSVCRQPVY